MVLPSLEQLTRRAEALARQARAACAAAGGSQPSFAERSDAVLAVARVLDRLGQVVAGLVARQVSAADLQLCLQAAAAGGAFVNLSVELYGLRDGRAAGRLGADLLGPVTTLLDEAQQVTAALATTTLPLPA